MNNTSANLLVKPSSDSGKVIDILPNNKDWQYVGFRLYRLNIGDIIHEQSLENEHCLVVIEGKIHLESDNINQIIGERKSPFEGKPWACYFPHSSAYSFKALTECEIAVTSSKADLKTSLTEKLISPNSLSTESRGKDTGKRYITNILMEESEANSLLVVEVITPNGHSSSYPPHKHDTDNLPQESKLEETYYHRLNPSQGYAFQRIYTDDHDLDETLTVHNGEVVMVPKGYHPVATMYGYDSYYLNVMAGPKRKWLVKYQSKHKWLLEN